LILLCFVQGYTGTPDAMRHTVPTTLLSDSQTDGDVSLEAVSATKPGSLHSLQGMAAVGGFGPVGPSAPVTNAPVDASSRRLSLKQRRRSNNMVRAPIASAEELSPASPQGCTPSDGPGADQLPVHSKSVDSHGAADVQSRIPHGDRAAPGTKTKTLTSHINTAAADSEDDAPSENVAFSTVSQTKLPSHKPASKLGKSTTSSVPAVSRHTDNSLPASLPSLPGAVRRPDSFALAMSDQLLAATAPRPLRGARSPDLETQPEEELSGIFEFSV